MALFLEQSLYGSLGWVVFEPNHHRVLHARALPPGSVPGLQAFQVRCDATTTTPDDQTHGIVNIVVAFAPLKPAEFVVIKLAQLAGQPQA